MNKRDLLLILSVVTVWGANFTVIKLGLDGVPPMLLVALRYILTAFPAILFVKRPTVGWRYCIAYGLTVGVGQFACLFYAMHIGMPAGVASVVLQSQAFFTILFAAFILNESIKGRQIVGLVVAGLGLYLIGGTGGGDDGGAANLSAIPLHAFLLTLAGAAFWGMSNIIVKYASDRVVGRGQSLDMLSLVVWSSLIPPIPLLAMAFMLDTPDVLWQAISSLNMVSVFSVFYLAFAATLFGFGTWGNLLTKYSAGKVAPFSLLVPITGLITAQIVIGEQLSLLQCLGCLAILLGIVIFNFGYALIGRVIKVKGT